MQILVIIILILLNAFFAAAEIAFISLNDAKIDIKAKHQSTKENKPSTYIGSGLAHLQNCLDKARQGTKNESPGERATAPRE